VLFRREHGSTDTGYVRVARQHQQGARKILKFVEKICTFLGVVGLCAVALVYLDAAIGSQNAIAAFDAAALLNPRHTSPMEGIATPDQSRWSTSARTRNVKAQAGDHDAPIAVLKIDRLNLKVPVFTGTDRVTLNRGAGIVEGTAQPGENGNVVISAHRDSYFRALKDIKVGDGILLETLDGPQQFHVADISITDPLDVSVLSDTDSSMLTLITCYPFYYVGFAPERYIVRAVPGPATVATPTSDQTVATAAAEGEIDGEIVVPMPGMSRSTEIVFDQPFRTIRIDKQ